MLVGRTPQPSTEYSRYEDGASDGVQVAVSLRKVSAEAQNALTASFEVMPEAHDGESAFRFRLAFSEPIAISFRSLREDAFAVTGGRVTRGKRVDGRKDLFEITVEPDGAGRGGDLAAGGPRVLGLGRDLHLGAAAQAIDQHAHGDGGGPAVETGPAALTAISRTCRRSMTGERVQLRIAFSETIRMSGRGCGTTSWR